jgi:predicted DNA-binding transcriptional regulator YafY
MKEKYVYDTKEIKSLIRKSFKEKRVLKIRYYSLYSDEVKYRKIDVLNVHKDCIVGYCHLREGERTFVIDRIRSAKMLQETYFIPEKWSPDSKIIEK